MTVSSDTAVARTAPEPTPRDQLIARTRALPDEGALVALLKERTDPLSREIIARHAPPKALGVHSVGKFVFGASSAAVALLHNPAIRHEPAALIANLSELLAADTEQPLLVVLRETHPDIARIARSFLTDAACSEALDPFGYASLVLSGWTDVPEGDLLRLAEALSRNPRVSELEPLIRHPSATMAVWQYLLDHVDREAMARRNLDLFSYIQAFLDTPARSIRQVRTLARQYGGWKLLANLLQDATDPEEFRGVLDELQNTAMPDVWLSPLENRTVERPIPLTRDDLSLALEDDDPEVRERAITLLGRLRPTLSR